MSCPPVRLTQLGSEPPVVSRAIFEDAAGLRSLCGQPADPSREAEAAFPLAFYEEFLREIRSLDVQTLTYRQLFTGCDDWEYANHYKREHKEWLRSRRDPRKTYLIIQHDVDNHPHFTTRMLALEALYGVRSNVFIFRDRFRQGADVVPYNVDHTFLKSAEACGWVIGYHQNAFALAGFELPAAIERFRQDVLYLRQLYNIDFMVPHGGIGREIDGRMVRNIDVPLPPEFENNLRWVYNRYCVRVDNTWSDGGLRKARDPRRIAALDLVGYLRSLKPGTRSFCLVHPQRWGFNVDMTQNPLLQVEPWYVDMCARYGVRTDSHAIARPATGAQDE